MLKFERKFRRLKVNVGLWCGGVTGQNRTDSWCKLYIYIFVCALLLRMAKQNKFQTVDSTHVNTDGSITGRKCSNRNLKFSIAQNEDNTGRSEVLEFSDKTWDKLAMLQAIQRCREGVGSSGTWVTKLNLEWGPSGPVGTIGPAKGKYSGAGKLGSLAAPCLHGKRSEKSHDGSLPNWFTSTLNMETLY